MRKTYSSLLYNDLSADSHRLSANSHRQYRRHYCRTVPGSGLPRTYLVYMDEPVENRGLISVVRLRFVKKTRGASAWYIVWYFATVSHQEKNARRFALSGTPPFEALFPPQIRHCNTPFLQATCNCKGHVPFVPHPKEERNNNQAQHKLI